MHMQRDTGRLVGALAKDVRIAWDRGSLNEAQQGRYCATLLKQVIGPRAWGLCNHSQNPGCGCCAID